MQQLCVTSKDGFSRVVTADEIEDKQFTFEPLRHIMTDEVESEPVDLPGTTGEISDR